MIEIETEKAWAVYEVRRAVPGFAPGDLLVVARDVLPEGGELVIDLHGRLGRHGGGPVWGVVVGAVRTRRRRTKREDYRRGAEAQS